MAVFEAETAEILARGSEVLADPGDDPVEAFKRLFDAHLDGFFVGGFLDDQGDAGRHPRHGHNFLHLHHIGPEIIGFAGIVKLIVGTARLPPVLAIRIRGQSGGQAQYE